MRRGHGTLYVLGFAAGLSGVLLAISSLALGLKPLKRRTLRSTRKDVLAAAGLVVSMKSLLLLNQRSSLRSLICAGTYVNQSLSELTDAQLAADVYKMKDCSKANNFSCSESNLRPVYLVGKGSEQVTIIPIAGKGLWSTVYGFWLGKGFNTVKGITFISTVKHPVWVASARRSGSPHSSWVSRSKTHRTSWSLAWQR